MRPFDLPESSSTATDTAGGTATATTTSQRPPLLSRTDMITIALVGIGIITVTTALLVLLF